MSESAPAAADSVQQNFGQYYNDLHRLARVRLHRDGGGFAINATALVNECYLKLQSVGSLENSQKTSFLAYASRTMRSVIVDLVRAELAERRGGGATMVTLNTHLADVIPGNSGEAGAVDVLAIDQALTQLEALDPRLARVVELRYFGGLTFAEVAEALGITMRTVQRDWDKAKMLLAISLKSGGS